MGPGPGPSAPSTCPPHSYLPSFPAFPKARQRKEGCPVASEQDPWGRDLGTDSPRARQPRSFTADLLSRVTQPV